MGVGLTIILWTLVICISVLFGIYMCLCSENKTKIFSNPRHEECIRELEKHEECIRELEKQVEELKEKQRIQYL